jgi:hypothetical protein
MSKVNSLKDSIHGGLNGILTSTAGKANPHRPDTHTDASRHMDTDPVVNCNFPIHKSIHRRMKILAVEKGISLRQMVNEAMLAYLKKNEK